MREDAATRSRGAIRTVALAIVMSALGPWAGASGGPPAPTPSGSSGASTTSGASLSAGPQMPGTLDFVPLARAAPTPQGPARVPPRSGSILLVAALPATGTYLLSVQMVTDLTDAFSGAQIAAATLRYDTRPVGPSAPEGCSSSGWRAIGEGSRVAVLHGPGVCRLRVRLRWSWGANAAPGHYRGALRWTLSSAAP